MVTSSHKAYMAAMQIADIVETQLDLIVTKTAVHECKWVDGVKSKYVLVVDMVNGHKFQQVFSIDCLEEMAYNNTVEMFAGNLIRKVEENYRKQLTNKK